MELTLNRERGLIQLPLMGWIVVGGAAALLLSWGALYVQTQRLSAVKAEYAGFVRDVKTMGEQAQKDAAKQVTADQRNKERTDAENTTLRAANSALARRLRDARASSSYVPAAPAGARRPELACFDRAELERAIGRLDAGISGLIEQGDQARIDLDSAKAWGRESVR